MEAEETWGWREVPVMRTVIRLAEQPVFTEIRDSEIVNATDLTKQEVRQSLRALNPTFLNARRAGTGEMTVYRITDKARQAAGQWPSPDSWIDDLVQALRAAADYEHDEEKRSRLRQAAEVLSGIAKETVVALIAQKIGPFLP